MVFDTIRELLADQLEISEDKITMDTDILGDLGAAGRWGPRARSRLARAGP